MLITWVCAQMYESVRNQRACLVIFESLDVINEFVKVLKRKPIDHPKYTFPNILSYETDEAGKQRVIGQATRQYAITLVERIFGRGTDFICHDSAVRSHKGVHVVQTFFADSLAEEVQIRGRTCRQDDPGMLNDNTVTGSSYNGSSTGFRTSRITF
jgi:preprotein translocase subunit SecA